MYVVKRLYANKVYMHIHNPHIKYHKGHIGAYMNHSHKPKGNCCC